MAHCKKYNRAACGHMFKHYERAKDENGQYIKFGNQEIDTSKSHLNYNLAAADQRGRQGEFVKKRCSEVKMQNRADVNVMCSWVVTVPKEVQPDETKVFLQETYNFLSNRYGKENVVSAYVHMDEVTPHMHFAFVPVVKDKKKDIYKVSAKELIDKKELSIFHKDLSEQMERVFGRDVGILNEATREGNKSIEELKRGTAQKNLEEIEQESKNRAQEARKADERINTLKKEEQGLEKKIKALETVFKGKQLTMKRIEKIQPTKGTFGLKDITIEEIESLKNTAMTVLQEKKELSKAKQEIEQLKKEKAELQKKIPTMKQTMAQHEQTIRIQAMERENIRLKNSFAKIIAGIEQLPEREQKIMKNVVDLAQGNKRVHAIDL